MFEGCSMLSDIGNHILYGKPSGGPGYPVEQAAQECADETCLPKSCFLEHPNDPRWEQFWQNQDRTPEGDMKAYKNAFDE